MMLNKNCLGIKPYCSPTGPSNNQNIKWKQSHCVLAVSLVNVVLTTEMWFKS